MKTQDYRSAITADISARDAFERIARICDWWTASVQGSSREVGDEFTVRFGETFVTFQVTEITPNKRAVWLVTDCNLHWINDKSEWKNTKLIWDLSSQDGKTQVTMTHVGLIPGIECYNDCTVGWNFYVQESLMSLLSDGNGLPDRRPREQSDWVSGYIKHFAALLKEPTKPFTLLGRMSIKPGMQEKLERAWAAAKAGTHSEPGVIAWQLNRDAKDSTHYAVYERWKSLADLERHLRTPYITRLKQEFDEVLASAPEFSVLVPAGE